MSLRVAAVCCLLVFAGVVLGEYSFEIHETITYSTVGDRERLLDAFIPNADGKYPAVLVVHGGAWRYGKTADS